MNKFVAAHQDLVRDQEAAEQARHTAYAERLRNEAVRSRLEEVRSSFYGDRPCDSAGARLQARHVLRELFELFDLDPKASFKIVGEQIDGAFTFDNTDYLLEAKWQKEPVGLADLEAFRGKIERKLENTLGLYLSVDGFAESAVSAHSSARPVMILMEGSDLMAVLEGRVDLIQLLLRKRRHAAQTGEILPLSIACLCS